MLFEIARYTLICSQLSDIKTTHENINFNENCYPYAFIVAYHFQSELFVLLTIYFLRLH